MSFTAFSQTLKPTVLTIKTDTNFCFTISQSKTIAKYLVKGKYADTLETNYNNLVVLVDKKELVQDSIQSNFKSKVLNLNQIVSNQDVRLGILQETVVDRDQRIKRGKWHKIGLGILSAVSTVGIILKQ